MTGHSYGSRLFDQHAAKLAGSAIDVTVARERGYVSADTKAQLAREGFGPAQRNPPALVIPLWNAAGQRAGAQLRPDGPRMLNGRPAKYETRAGQKMLLDVPPRVRPQLGDPSVPLVITEGPLKADAAVSAGLACVSLLGVWAWRGTNEDQGKVALADWEYIALNGRTVVVAFDSDVMLKPQVHGALARLGAFLTNRGAQLAYAYLPHGEAGAKVGLDDWLADGHAGTDLFDLASPELRQAPGEPAATEPADTFDDLADEPLSAVLDDLQDWLRAHVAYQSPHHAPAVALWCAHTHALDAAASTPRIAFESPEPESGKSRNLELMECVTHQGRLVLQPSTASLYRWVEAIRPTILLDEVDTIFGPKASRDWEDLRGIVNAGHRPGATVPRVHGDTMQVVEFSCYCPVALAGISGALPDTIRSRSIRIPMRRRAPDETVTPFRERTTRPQGEALRRRLAAWVSRHGDNIAEAPELPDGVTDRQADQWEPLIAIADAAGGHWPQTARQACLAIVTEARANTDDQSLGVRLLADIRTVFGDADRITTADLLDKLHGLDESPWGDLHGKPVDSRWLARKLKPYAVRPTKVRVGDATAQGYRFEDFHDLWSRYLDDPERNIRNKRNTPGRDVPDVPDVPDTSASGTNGHTPGRERIAL